MRDQHPSPPQSIGAPLLLTFREAAAKCACSCRSIQRAIQEGELQAVNAPGTSGNRGKRIPFRTLEEWLRRSTTPRSG